MVSKKEKIEIEQLIKKIENNSNYEIRKHGNKYTVLVKHGFIYLIVAKRTTTTILNELKAMENLLD